MLKKSICILVILSLLVFCPACSITGTTNTTENTPTATEESLTVTPDTIGFEAVASYKDGDVTYTYYRCRTTDTMFVWREHEGGGGLKLNRGYGGFTAMLDPETGGPLTYENWLAYLEAKTGEVRES